MNVKLSPETPQWKFLISLCFCMLLVGGLLFTTTASAQIPPAIPPVSPHCIEDAVEDILFRCFSNDVNPGQLVVERWDKLNVGQTKWILTSERLSLER